MRKLKVYNTLYNCQSAKSSWKSLWLGLVLNSIHPSPSLLYYLSHHYHHQRLLLLHFNSSYSTLQNCISNFGWNTSDSSCTMFCVHFLTSHLKQIKILDKVVINVVGVTYLKRYRHQLLRILTLSAASVCWSCAEVRLSSSGSESDVSKLFSSDYFQFRQFFIFMNEAIFMNDTCTRPRNLHWFTTKWFVCLVRLTFWLTLIQRKVCYSNWMWK